MLSECQRRAEGRRLGALRRRGRGTAGAGPAGPHTAGGRGCGEARGAREDGPEETGALRSTAGGYESRAAGGGS